jgi:hypothetical protein
MGARQQQWMPFWTPFLMAGEQFVEITSSHRIKLITWLFYQIRLNSTTVLLANSFRCLPMHLRRDIHRIYVYAIGGKMAHHDDDVCEGSSNGRQQNSLTIPTVRIPQAGVFVPAGTLIAVQLLIKIRYSSFNNVDLLCSILADCCMPWHCEWGPMVAMG